MAEAVVRGENRRAPLGTQFKMKNATFCLLCPEQKASGFSCTHLLRGRVDFRCCLQVTERSTVLPKSVPRHCSPLERFYVVRIQPQGRIGIGFCLPELFQLW